MSRKPRQRNAESKQRRREAIVDAAERVFDEDGFDQATMERIAGLAKISRALLYVYFPNKSTLYLEICARALRRMQEASLASAAREDSGLRQLECIVRAHVKFAWQQPRCFSGMNPVEADRVQDCSSNRATREAERTVHQLTVECLQRGVDDGSIRADLGDPRIVALSFWGYVHGMAQLSWAGHSLLPQGEVSLDRYTTDATGFFLRSLRALPE